MRALALFVYVCGLSLAAEAKLFSLNSTGTFPTPSSPGSFRLLTLADDGTFAPVVSSGKSSVATVCRHMRTGSQEHHARRSAHGVTHIVACSPRSCPACTRSFPAGNPRSRTRCTHAPAAFDFLSLSLSIRSLPRAPTTLLPLSLPLPPASRPLRIHSPQHTHPRHPQSRRAPAQSRGPRRAAPSIT